MDILAARKKAAERLKAKQQEPEAVSEPAAPPPAVETEIPPRQAVGNSEPAKDAGTTAVSPQSGTADRPPAAEEPAAGAGDTPQAASELEQLAFYLGAEAYVVPVDNVREVLTPRDMTPVPHAPGYVLGVCSLRGAVLPVFDLALRLGLAGRQRDEKARIIVVGLTQDDRVGLLVDRIQGVVKLSADAVMPAPDNVAQAAGAEFLHGIARKDDRLYILLDLKKTIGD